MYGNTHSQIETHEKFCKENFASCYLKKSSSYSSSPLLPEARHNSTFSAANFSFAAAMIQCERGEKYDAKT